MKTTGIRTNSANRLKNEMGERLARPWPGQPANSLAAYPMYTLKDTSGNNRNLILGPKAKLLDDGALQLGLGPDAYAICDGLILPTTFTIVMAVWLGTNTGAIFGNFIDTATGFRIYSTSTALMAKVGDDNGRAVITTDPTGWKRIGVCKAGSSITLCTETEEAFGTDASPQGAGVCRFGSQEAAGVTSAGGTIISIAAITGAAMTTPEMRRVMAKFKPKAQIDSLAA